MTKPEAFFFVLSSNLAAVMNRSWLFLLILCPLFSFSQVKITGVVLNMGDTKPVASASVFLSNTTSGDETAGDGTFTIVNIKPGKYDLIVSILGYDSYQQAIIVGNKDIQLAPISLVSSAIMLKAVKIKPDNGWYRLYKDFKAEFLGNSSYAAECKIRNPDSLELNYDPDSRQLTARSRGFLIIENKALGYRIKYLLTRFVKDYKQQELVYKGYTIFEELKGSPAEKIKWIQNRLDCYRGSPMHFLRAVLKDRVEAEGFGVYKLIRRLNPDYAGLESSSGLITRTPQFKYREIFTDSIVKRTDYFDETQQKGIYTIDYPNSLYIIYKNRVDYQRAPVYKQFNMPNWESSILTLTQPILPPDSSASAKPIMVAYPKLWNYARVLKPPYAFFDDNGVLTDPMMVAYEGYWAFMRVAELLPVNYEP